MYSEASSNLRISQAVEGNRRALESLLADAYPLLLGYMNQLTGDRELAKDLTQEVMVKAIVNIKSFRNESKFSSWLISIGINLYKDYCKKNKTIPFGPADLEPLITLKSISDSALETVIGKEQSQKLLEVIRALPLEQQHAFILKHVYGLTYEQIAALEKCPIGTVRSRLHNGIKTLRSKLEKGGGIW